MKSSRCSAYIAAMLAIAFSAAAAQFAIPTGPPSFDLSWNTIDAGGDTFSSGSSFDLGGTIGQPDAGPVMIGSGFELVGGFWSSGLRPVCPWDCADNNGEVDIMDFLALLGQLGVVGTPCDFDGGGVTVDDFQAILANLGPCPS